MPRFHVRSSRLGEAKRLRRIRQYLQISQRDLATEFKVGHGAISFWESGMRTIPGPILKLIEIYEAELGISSSFSGESRTPLKKIQSSWISRHFTFSALLAQIAARVAEKSLQKAVSQTEVHSERIDEITAQKLESNLGQLKGLMTKLGQMMSYTDLALSETARERLARLQDRSVALDTHLIEEVFKSEMECVPENVFSEWTSVPIGVGSIGQVHRAKLKDEGEVAVKVQFPEMSQSIESDLKSTKVVEILLPLFYRKQDCHFLTAELKDRFLHECDYLKEAQSQDFFRKAFANDTTIRIPKVFPELTTKRVLTTSLSKGSRFSEFIKNSSDVERSAAGQTICRMSFSSAFNHHILNCDPNPGNYLFLGDGIVEFIDFGCVVRLNGEFVKRWKDYIRAFIENDRKRADDLIVEMGYVPNTKLFDFDYHFELMRMIYRPWLEQRSFRFDKEYVISIWKRIADGNPNRSKVNLPREWMFIHRLQWGLYSVLAGLEADGDWRSILLPLLYKT